MGQNKEIHSLNLGAGVQSTFLFAASKLDILPYKVVFPTETIMLGHNPEDNGK